MDEMLTVDEVATLLQLSPYSVRQMIRDGRLPGEKLGYRTVRIPRAAIEAMTTGQTNRTLRVSESTAAALYDEAAREGQEPDQLADALLAEALQDLRETVAGIQRGIEAAKAGDVVDLEDYIASEYERRRMRGVSAPAQSEGTGG